MADSFISVSSVTTNLLQWNLVCERIYGMDGFLALTMKMGGIDKFTWQALVFGAGKVLNEAESGSVTATGLRAGGIAASWAALAESYGV